MYVLIGWPGGDWQSTLEFVALIIGTYMALIWLATILWTYRDIRSRTGDPFSQVVGVVLALIPFVGLPLYFVVRPRETRQRAYDHQLEQEAILSELYAVSVCPECRRPVQDEFVVCPYCQGSLKESCRSCERLLVHSWSHCPYCAVTRESQRDASRLNFDVEELDTDELGDSKSSERQE